VYTAYIIEWPTLFTLGRRGSYCYNPENGGVRQNSPPTFAVSVLELHGVKTLKTIIWIIWMLSFHTLLAFFLQCPTASFRPGPSHYRGFTIARSNTNIFGRTPLDEWSARHRVLYMTTHNSHKRQTAMTPLGFEPTIPACDRPQTARPLVIAISYIRNSLGNYRFCIRFTVLFAGAYIITKICYSTFVMWLLCRHGSIADIKKIIASLFLSMLRTPRGV